jgi:hypothetical protein
MNHDINKVTNFFNKFLLSSKYGRINSIGFKRKEISGEKTEVDCISFKVNKKQSEAELKNNRIQKIPSKITFDGVEYLTDVTEGDYNLFACSDCNTAARTPGGVPLICGYDIWYCGGTVFPSDTRAAINNYRRSTRPVRGGTGVTSIEETSPETAINLNSPNAGSIGTLGFVAVDALTNNLVGVTNAHVIALKNSNRPGFNAYDRVNAINGFSSDVYDFENLKIYQGGVYDVASSLVIDEKTLNNVDVNYSNMPGLIATYWWQYLRVGAFKRFYPFKRDQNSWVDCAIFDLINRGNGYNVPISLRNGSYVWRTYPGIASAEDISWQILGFPKTQKYFPFASTQEINTLPNNPNIKIFLAGRSSGAKGLPGEMSNNLSAYNNASCQINVNSVTESVYICEGGNCAFEAPANEKINTLLSPSIEIAWRNCPGTQISQGGDSGSAVLAEFNGIWKIIGILYGGNSSSGIAVVSRIDYIAPLLNIKPYMGQALNQPKTIPTNKIVVKNKQSMSWFLNPSDNKVYNQLGTTTSAANLQQIP